MLIFSKFLDFLKFSMFSKICCFFEKFVFFSTFWKIIFWKYCSSRIYSSYCFNGQETSNFCTKSLLNTPNFPIFGFRYPQICGYIRMYFFDYKSDQKMVCELTRIEKEFGLHIWRIYSPHEYYKTVEFQLQTPTGSGRTRKSCYYQVP